MRCASRLMNVQLLLSTSLVFVGLCSMQFCFPSYAKFIIAMTLQDGQWSDKTIMKQITSLCVPMSCPLMDSLVPLAPLAQGVCYGQIE